MWLFGYGDAIFLKELKEGLHISFYYSWCYCLDTSKRLSSYNNYKSCFRSERYVDGAWMEAYRSSLTRFRMGVSHINVDRPWFVPTTEHTMCVFCANKKWKIHFVFKCPVYDQLRSKYLADIISVHNPSISHTNLTNGDSQNKVLNVVKFLLNTLDHSRWIWILEQNLVLISIESSLYKIPMNGHKQPCFCTKHVCALI